MISIKHKFNSTKGDGTDSTLLRPSNWNAEHDILLGADKLMGRATAGNGPVEEIPCTAAGRGLLDKADVAAIIAYLGIAAFSTGDVKLTMKNAADAGWLIFDDGTFGSATSNASQRANNDTQNLFNLLFQNLNDTNAPLLTAAGGATTRAAQSNNAATAWGNACRMSLPKALGRALAIAGSGSGLTARQLGATAGAETHTLATANLPPYTPAGTIAASGTVTAATITNAFNTGTAPNPCVYGSNTVLNVTITATFTGTPQGGTSTPINHIPPTSYLNAMVKL